jgi:shikimate dehydrogenase
VLENATSASLSGARPELPGNPLAPGAACYDLVYAAVPTPFMVWAEEKGAGVIADGLGMLVEQAAESFELWRGVRPPTEGVRLELRALLGTHPSR